MPRVVQGRLWWRSQVTHGVQEPHPGDDLNGADVARKLTILSRMIPGLLELLPNGHLDVHPTSLVPEPLRGADAQMYLQRLPEFDSDIAAKRDEAAKRGNVLRYVGVIDVEQRKVEAKLHEYVSLVCWMWVHWLNVSGTQIPQDTCVCHVLARQR